MVDNLLRYKRLFTFGCSFTRYGYLTWADVLSKEMPHAKFYNLGYPGCGNTLISLRIAEANNRFNFDKDDLVIVMYTSVCREDRYVNGKWLANGNIFNNYNYDKNFLEKYADQNGYLIQSMGMIELSMKYLQSLPCTSLFLLGYPFDIDNPYDIDTVKKLNSVYTLALSNISKTTCYLTYLGKENFMKTGYTFINEKGEIENDSHPLPIYAYEYLQHLKFPLTDKSYIFASEETTRMKKLNSKKKIQEYYKDYFLNILDNTKDMFG